MSLEQSLQDIPKLQKQSPIKSLEYYQLTYADCGEIITIAHRSGHYLLSEVNQQFEVKYATVSRAVKKFEASVKCKV